MKLRYIILSSLFTLTLISPLTTFRASAQELNESVEIEGRYKNDIIKTDKIYSFPRRDRTTLQTVAPAFDTEGVITPFAAQFMTLPATTKDASRQIARNRGYASLSLGSWLGTNLSAGYKIIDSQSTSFGIFLQHNSTSLWKPYSDSDLKRFDYNTLVGLNLQHHVGNQGTIISELSWHNDYFNYFFFPNSLNPAKAPTQTLNDIIASIGWNSAPADYLYDKFTYNGRLSYRTFNYRSFYAGADNAFKGDREHHIALTGSLNTAGVNDFFRLKGSLNMLIYNRSDFYSSSLKAGLLSSINSPLSDNLFLSPRNYSLISLSPAWIINRHDFHIQLGLNADLAFNAPGSEPDSHFSLIHISPDIRIDYASKHTSLYLHVGGGTKLNTLASNNDFNPYTMPLIQGAQPQYNPVDAKLGFGVGPFSGFSAGLELGYAIALHTQTGGLYAMMFSNPRSNNYLPVTGLAYSPGLNMHGINAGINLKYEPAKWLNLSTDFKWTPQNGNFGTFNGYDRPRYCMSTCVVSKPISPLTLNLEYNLRAGRAIYNQELLPMSTSVVSPQIQLTKLQKQCLGNISTLNFKVSWSFSDKFSASATAINLLNRKTVYLPGIAANGIELFGGVSVLF